MAKLATVKVRNLRPTNRPVKTQAASSPRMVSRAVVKNKTRRNRIPASPTAINLRRNKAMTEATPTSKPAPGNQPTIKARTSPKAPTRPKKTPIRRAIAAIQNPATTPTTQTKTTPQRAASRPKGKTNPAPATKTSKAKASVRKMARFRMATSQTLINPTSSRRRRGAIPTPIRRKKAGRGAKTPTKAASRRPPAPPTPISRPTTKTKSQTARARRKCNRKTRAVHRR